MVYKTKHLLSGCASKGCRPEKEDGSIPSHDCRNLTFFTLLSRVLKYRKSNSRRHRIARAKAYLHHVDEIMIENGLTPFYTQT